MKKKILQLQEDKNDCAAACMSSIIKYYNGHLDMETIRNFINTTKNGTNAYDLINGAKDIGFESYGRKVKFEEIYNYKDLFPVIAHVKKNNMYHFVVIYGIDERRKKINVMDPSVGMRQYKYDEFDNMFLGTLLFFNQVKELPNIKTENKLFHIVIEGLRKNKKKMIILSMLSLITFVCSLVDIFYYKIIFDNSISSKSIYLKYCLLFIVIIILKNILVYLRNRLSLNVNYNISMYINNEMIDRLFCLPYSYYKNKSTGEVVSRINDLDSLKELISNLVLNAFVDVFLIIISLTLMFILNFKLTLICILIILVYLIIVIIYHKKYILKVRLVQESKGFYNHNIIETLDSMESISNLNVSNLRKEIISKSYLNYNNLSKDLNTCFVNSNFFKFLVSDIGLVLLLTVGGIMTLKQIITIGDLMLIYMIVSYFLEVIKSLLDKDFEISYVFKNIEKVNGMLVDKNISNVKDKVLGDIAIDGITYAYSMNNVIFKNKSLVIKEGEKVLLTGKSGSGKSTLIKIILKYLTNYKGHIAINGTELSLIDDKVIRNSFMYVGQNEKLFNDTLKNNILLGRKVLDSDYEKVLQICELESVRDSRKFKDDFIIETDGFNISGGERQRIVLARALIRDANYLVLDEALSEVNVKLEKKILNNIFSNYSSKTLIYVSHKDEVKKLFSKVYDIERR